MSSKSEGPVALKLEILRRSERRDITLTIQGIAELMNKIEAVFTNATTH